MPTGSQRSGHIPHAGIERRGEASWNVALALIGVAKSDGTASGGEDRSAQGEPQ